MKAAVHTKYNKNNIELEIPTLTVLREKYR